MCNCTDHTHEDVRRLIGPMRLQSVPAMMQDPGWKSAGGGASCGPALNDDLLADGPTEYFDDRKVRFVNEPSHADIRKDGTCSVVPRIRGGVAIAVELRAIADAADRYGVPMKKIAGGQQIDHPGVTKQDLTAIRSDFDAADMVSGHACAKRLRTENTCLGTGFCRFGKQDSTGLAIRIEKLLKGRGPRQGQDGRLCLSRIRLVDQRIGFVIRYWRRLREALVGWEISGRGERDATCCFGSACRVTRAWRSRQGACRIAHALGLDQSAHRRGVLRACRHRPPVAQRLCA